MSFLHSYSNFYFKCCQKTMVNFRFCTKFKLVLSSTPKRLFILLNEAIFLVVLFLVNFDNFLFKISLYNLSLSCCWLKFTRLKQARTPLKQARHDDQSFFARLSRVRACLSRVRACLSGVQACLSRVWACLSGVRACLSGVRKHFKR